MMEYLDKLVTKKNTYLAFGSFDGVHKGHLAVLEQLVKKGKDDRRETVVISCYSKADTQEGILTTEEEKAFLIEKTGVDCMISYYMEETDFSLQDFYETVLFGTLDAKLIVTSASQKDLAALKEYAGRYGCEVCVIDSVKYQGRMISSGLVRNYLREGLFKHLDAVCGHAYVITGEVIHGKAIGRTVGMPTANQGVLEIKCKPPNGVYATRSTIEGKHYYGLTNIGTRPSVDDLPAVTIETFLMDFDQDIYGQKLILEVFLYIRGIRKFESLQDVQYQVQKDLVQVKDYLGSLPG